MPELTDEKLARFAQFAASRGSSIEAAREHLDRIFVAGEKDPRIRDHNRILLTKYAGPETGPRTAYEGPNPAAALMEKAQERPAPESPIKAALGSFVIGGLRTVKPIADIALSQIPGKEALKRHPVGQFIANPPEAGIKMLELATGKAQAEYPKISRTAEIAGGIAPMMAIPGAAFSTPLRAAATGAGIGFGTTEGDVAERAKAAGWAAASFGLAGKANAVLRAPLSAAGGRLLAAGVAPKAVVRLLPRVAQAATDATAFSAVQAFEHRNDPNAPPLADLFLANLGTIAIAHGLGATMPGADGRMREAVDIRHEFGKGTPAQVLAKRSELLSQGRDAELVHVAYMEALKGRGMTPEEARLLARGGPEAIRRKLSPERVADIFAVDQPQAAAKPETAPVQAESGADFSRQLKEREAAASNVAATQTKRADAVLRATTLRNDAERIDANGQRLVDAAGRAVADLAMGKPTSGRDPAELARRGDALKTKAARLRSEADRIETAAETAADVAIDAAKRLSADAGQQQAIARILPSDSNGAARLRDTSAEDFLAMRDRLGESGAAISPDTPINIRPGGEAKLADDLARTPPSEPGSEFDRANGVEGGDIGRVMPWDYARMVLRTATKLLGPKLGREYYEKSTVASAKTRNVKHLMRRAAADRLRRWSRWMEFLSPADQQTAIQRVVDSIETGSTQGAHPIETELLTFWNRAMRGYANAHEAAGGKPFALKGRYLSHVFETLDASDAASARRAASAIMQEWRGKPGAAGGGSRFLHARASGRKDFSHDLFFLFDAYVNSMTPAIHWRPVRDWLGDRNARTGLFREGGPFDEILAGRLAETGGDLKEAKKVRDRMDEAADFLRKHIDSGMGRQPGWFHFADTVDAGLSRMLRPLGIKSERPWRNALRFYTYAQYVGGLGLNVGSAVRNLTQQVNTIAEVGPTWWWKAHTLMTEIGRGGRPEISRLLRQAHINDGALSRDVRTSVRSALGNLPGAVNDIAMGLFTAAEWINRSNAYLAGYLKAKARGLPEMAARKYGREVMGRTQFDYTPGLGGILYGGPFTHALFQFTRFPIYQTDYLGSVIGRAIRNDTRGMLPGDLAAAPLLRLAAATLVTSPLLAALGMDFNDSFGIGGVPEPVKFVATRGAEAVGRQFGGFEGELSARRAMRRVGLEPYETSIGEAAKRTFGPLYQQGEAILDWATGDVRERHLAGIELARRATVLFPGLSTQRFLRFLQEYDDKQVRNGRTGEVMFPITDGDAFKRLIGMNSPSVIEGYERVRDEKIRTAQDAGMRANLYDDVREEYRSLRDAKDKDYAAKSYAKFAAGLIEIYRETGVRPLEDPAQAFRQNVVERIELGDRTTAAQRTKPTIDRSRILGPVGK